MRSSKKQGVKQLTSAIMALVMTATTTFQMPSASIIIETDSSVAVKMEAKERSCTASLNRLKLPHSRLRRLVWTELVGG